MRKTSIIVTGCDANFYPFMAEALQSLSNLGLDRRADIGVLNLGLTPGQVATLSAMGCTVKEPGWSLSVSPAVAEATFKKYQIGLVARTALRDYFPGYKVYLWFDADAWAQTPEFFDTLVDGALANGAAVIRENGSHYKRDLIYTRWWFGNMVTSFGVWNGLKVAFKPAMNIGILALSDTAPHWEHWIDYYQHFIAKRGKVNNQHSFNAAVELEHLPCFSAPARCNWITTLSAPAWNPATKMLCEPNSGAIPLSVIHMAGPDKRKPYTLQTTDGKTITTSLTYSAISAIQEPDDVGEVRQARIA